jgi:7,8-dihydropterin-6-yl-methyl-4-(beta-D-ribofuranosyl)aminobenzene 5'-phosphate synthase
MSSSSETRHDELQYDERGNGVPGHPDPGCGPSVGSVPGPISLEPVDEVCVTVLVDNCFDSLAMDTDLAVRPRSSRLRSTPSKQFVEGRTGCGLRAEHGYGALVTVRSQCSTRTLLLDTGISPDGLLSNVDALGIDLAAVEAVVLSHGHYDHVGGLTALARRRRGLPLVMHPEAWSRRRFDRPGQGVRPLPTVDRSAIERAGYRIEERTGPSTLAGGQVLVTGQIDRITPFEQGTPFHEAFRDGKWVADPDLLDDQALVVLVRGKGLVVLTGCGHSGVINTLEHARRLTGIDRVHAVLGGLHLSGADRAGRIDPTVDRLTEDAPDLIVPSHCTGWEAQFRIATDMPNAFVPNSVGTTYVLRAQPPV